MSSALTSPELTQSSPIPEKPRLDPFDTQAHFERWLAEINPEMSFAPDSAEVQPADSGCVFTAPKIIPKPSEPIAPERSRRFGRKAVGVGAGVVESQVLKDTSKHRITITLQVWTAKGLIDYYVVPRFWAVGHSKQSSRLIIHNNTARAQFRYFYRSRWHW